MSVVQVNYGYSRPLPLVSRPGSVVSSSSPARRRLFSGEIQVEEDAMKVLERQYALIQREQTLKYNFDFEAEKPLSGGGRYIWERPSHPLPPPVAFKRSLEEEDSSSDPPAKQAKCLTSTSTLQTKITDFMKHQKVQTEKQRHPEHSASSTRMSL